MLKYYERALKYAGALIPKDYTLYNEYDIVHEAYLNYSGNDFSELRRKLVFEYHKLCNYKNWVTNERLLICKQCKEEKPANTFRIIVITKGAQTQTYQVHLCGDCVNFNARNVHRNNYAKNPEKYLAKSRKGAKKYYHKNKNDPEFKARQKQHNLKRKDKIKANDLRGRMFLTDRYIRSILANTIDKSLITPELMQWKRRQIYAQREAKNMKTCALFLRHNFLNNRLFLK